MKVAILDDYAGAALQMADWQALGADITVFRDTLPESAALYERLQPFDIICAMRERTPFPASVIDALPNLQLLVTTGPRNLSIDLDAAAAKGVIVCGTESRKTSTSELSMTMLLTLSRRLLPEVNAMHTSGWQTGLGRDLAGQTLGLIGLGKIGAQMVALGKAFGMNVCAWSSNLQAQRCEELQVDQCATLEELMSSCDATSVHLVLSDRSRGLIGAGAFEAMKPGSIFINTSRGPIADNSALIASLHKNETCMAGIDVFDEEPLPLDHPMRDRQLIESGRLLLTPHLGYVTEQTWRVFYQQTVDAIAAWQAGAPIRLLTPG